MSIVKIVLNINGVDTPISMDDAKVLFEDLKQIFDPVKVVNIPTMFPQGPIPRDVGHPFDDYKKTWPTLDPNAIRD